MTTYGYYGFRKIGVGYDVTDRQWYAWDDSARDKRPEASGKTAQESMDALQISLDVQHGQKDKSA